MLELACILKTLELYAHSAHHICARIVFLQDHEFLAEIYTKANGDYDNVIERFIGIKSPEALDEAKIIVAAAQKMAALPLKEAKENKELLNTCLNLLQAANAKIEVICKDPATTQGTIQMIGDIADKNEVLMYKLKMRLK